MRLTLGALLEGASAPRWAFFSSLLIARQTDMANPGLMREVVQDIWPLSGVRFGEILSDTNGNKVVRVIRAREGCFVLREFCVRKKKSLLVQALSIFDTFVNYNVRWAPLLIKTRCNEYFKEFEGRVAYIVEYIDGKKPISNPETYEKIGDVVASLHLLNGHTHETDFCPNLILSRGLHRIGDKGLFWSDYITLVKSIPDMTRFARCLIHTDIGINNIIERPTGELVLIDWDDAGLGSRVFDLAFPLLEHFLPSSKTFKSENARAFYRRYRQRVFVKEIEMGHIYYAALAIALVYIEQGQVAQRWDAIKRGVLKRDQLERTLNDS